MAGNVSAPIEASDADAFPDEGKSLCILAVNPKSGPAIRIHLPRPIAERLAGQIEGACRTLRQSDPSNRRKPRGERLKPF